MIDLAELLRVQIADVTELLSEKELSLTVDIPDKLLCEVDSAQMERALQNILINAIRYSPNGEEINISLSNEKNTNIVFCKIENTGVTIPEEEISHLFEAFYRVDASRNRNTGGTGLGLYIVAKSWICTMQNMESKIQTEVCCFGLKCRKEEVIATPFKLHISCKYDSNSFAIL